MDVDYKLTPGACARITSAPQDDASILEFQPTLQVLSIKKVPNATGASPDRYRLILSDGGDYVQAMLATQLNHLIVEGAFTKHTVAVMENFTRNIIQNKRLMIVLGVQILGTTEDKIGEPTALDIGIQAQGGANAPPDTSKPAGISKASPDATMQQARPSSGPSNGSPTFPIEGLNPYQNKWTIKALVTSKSEMRHYSNQKGDGKLFSVNLMDETGEIKGTAFNQVADELFSKFQESKVYFISKGRIQLAKQKFSQLTNQYELSFDRQTEVEECHDASMPAIKYNFIQLKDLEEQAKDTNCDVIGVVKEVGPVSEIVTKSTQKTTSKRELTLVDRSGYSVRVTLWANQAISYSATDQPVMAIKGARVGDYGGRSLSVSSSSTMMLNPDIAEAHSLRGWFDASGSGSTFQSHSTAMTTGAGPSGGVNRSEMKTVEQVKDQNLGEEKVDYFSTCITVVHVKTDAVSYPACPTAQCNKKVTDNGGEWRCEKCDRSYSAPEYRFILTFSGADHTGTLWLQGFNDAGQVIFGMSANELMALKEQDQDAYDEALRRANCQVFNVGCRAKQETYNDNTRIRYGITRIEPLDLTVDTGAMLDRAFSFA